MILYGDVLICSLQPRAIGFRSAVRACSAGAFTCECVQILLNELTVAEAKEYCRYAFRERKKVEGFWDTTCNEPIQIN